MNEALQKLEIKVENGGSTPQGRVSAAEWNVLVAGVKALDLAGFDENALRDYLDQYDYITRPELDKALEGITSGGGGSIKYPLSWSGYSSGMYDGSAPANIAIPSLLSQLVNDSNYITTDSVNSLLTDYLSKSGGVVSGNITAPKFIGALQGNADSATLWSYNSPWVQDFDALNYSNNGLYHFDGDYLNLIGGPPHNYWNYSVLNMGSGSGRRQQVAIPYSSSRMFLRVNVDDNWRDWREFAFLDSTMYPTGDVAMQFPNGEYFDKFGNLHFSEKSGAWSVFYPSGVGLFIVHANGTVETTGDLISRGTIYLREIESKAIEFPEGEYIDRYGNIVLPSTASQWSVKNSNMMLLAVRNDGEIQLNGTIHFTTEVPMIKMVENGWAQSKVMWHSWDSTEGDSLWLQIPSGAENDVYFKLSRLAPSILNTSLQVNGTFLTTSEVTQHSSLVLKDVGDTRFLTLKELVALKPYSFRWKDKRDDKLHAGAVADYVKPILPEVISTDKDNIHSMNYANAAWVVGTSLTPYVSKHEEEIEILKSRVKYLEGRLKES